MRDIDDIRRCREQGLYGAICGKSLYSGTLKLADAVAQAETAIDRLPLDDYFQKSALIPAVVQENIKRGIADACKENKDIKFKCIIMEYEYDIADEEQCFQALYRSCDGIIIEFDADREGPHRDIIDKINAKGLPVVSIVVQPSRLRTSLHVSADAENIGRMAADVFRIGLRGNCSREVVIFGGKKEVDIHQRNIRGFREVCGSYQIDLKEIVYTNDAEKNIPPLVLQTFQKHPAVAGIFVSNYLAYRVCDVLRELGRADNVLVVGVD